METGERETDGGRGGDGDKGDTRGRDGWMDGWREGGREGMIGDGLRDRYFYCSRNDMHLRKDPRNRK